MLQYLANTLFDQLHSVQPEDWLLCPLSEPQDSQGCFGTYTAAHRNTLSGGRSGLSNNQALSSVPILRFFYAPWLCLILQLFDIVITSLQHQ